MALPEIIKDIEAIIRPTSTDNAIVRFDGTTGQVQNSTPLIDDNGNIVLPNDIGSIRKSYTTANTTPILNIAAGDQDVSIFRASWSSSFSEKSSWGYTLKYIGTGSGANNFLRLYTDDSQASSQIIGLSMNQPGYLGIGADPKSTHRLYINGNTYCEDSITLQTSNSAYDPVGLIFGSTSARIGADSVNLGLYSKGSLYIRTGCDFDQNSYPNGILIQPTGIIPLTTGVTLGTPDNKWTNVYSTVFTGNLTGTASNATNVTVSAGSGNLERPIIVHAVGIAGQNLWHVEGITANYTNKTITAAGGFIGKLVGNADTATTATLAKYIKTETGTTDSSRHVFFRYDGDPVSKSRVVYTDKFKYNPSTDILTVGNITLTGGTIFYDDKIGGQPILKIGSYNKNTTIFRIWSSDAAYASQGVYGFSLVYTGASNGNDNKLIFYADNQTATSQIAALTITQAGIITANKLYGAVWNDYAEFRNYKDSNKIPYGRVVIENGDDSLSLSTERLQLGGNICSDTFGFAIGETDNARLPIAVSGRVLAYTNEPRDTYKPGEALCSGPNGTVSKMTREEIKEYPDAIIGYVSAVPDYEVWGTGNVKVDGRIWVKIK